MSNKDNDNKNSANNIFSEDITKKLVKKILEDDIASDNNFKEKSDFNIEYEEYDIGKNNSNNDNYTYKNNYTRDNIKSSSRHRKKIEEYGKEFFDDEEYYEDDYEDENQYKTSLVSKAISIAVIATLTISTSFLAFSLISTKAELKTAKEEIQELKDAKNKLLETSLTDASTSLNISENSTTENSSNHNNKQETQNNSNNLAPANNSNTTGTNSNNSTQTEYIVKEGDTIWKISKKVYGSGANFQKILDANNLKENSVLSPGQKLIIPKI